MEDATSELENLNVQIGYLENEIKEFQQKIELVEKEYERQEDQKEKEYLRRKEEQLRKEKEQLRKEKEQLRKEKEQLRKEKELLIQERIQLRSTSGEAKLDKDAFRQEVEKVLDDREKRVKRDFSDVSESCSRKLLRILQIRMVDGADESPIKVPEGFICGTFPMRDYSNEQQAHPDFLTFLAEELKAKGVMMGMKGGFKVIDLRRRTLYHLNIGDLELAGGVDAIIAPWGTSEMYPESEVRCSIELKHGKAPKGEAFFSGTTFGQSLAEVVAAFISAEYPVLLHVTTSVYDNVLLEMRREEGKGVVIVHWSGVTFDAALFKLVEYLKECDASLPYYIECHREVPDSSELVHWRKKLRLEKGSLLLDQLESLSAICDTPGERFFCAYDLVRQFRQKEVPDTWTAPEPLKGVPSGMYM